MSEGDEKEGVTEGRADDEMLMDHVAMEAIHAVHSRDHGALRNAFHTLVAHTLGKMTADSKEVN